MNVKVADTIFPSIQIHMRSDDYKFKLDTNDYLFETHQPIMNPDASKYYMTAELTNGEFPVSFFNVNERNNVLNYSCDDTDFSHTIPVGNYNMGQLLTALQNLLNASSSYPPQLGWSSSNNKLSITFSKKYEIKEGTANKLFGLENDVGKSSDTAGTLTGSSMCDIRGITNLYVHTDLFSNGYSSNVQKENNSHNVLARIPVDAGAYGTVLYKPMAPHCIPIAKKSFKAFRMNIRDPEGRNVNMNDMKWSATITVRFHKINSEISDYNSLNNFNGGLMTNFAGGQPTEHLLRSWIDEITNEYKSGNLDYSRLGVN